MEAAVGVVASVVGIAAFGQQLASSILKIKQFSEDVKDAPEELRDVLDQIGNISNIMTRLGMLEASPAPEVDDVFQASVQLCRTAIGRISALAQELEDEVKTSRLRGSMIAVLKKKTLEKLLIKLERNKADLLIAHQMYADVRKSRELERLQRCVDEIRDGQLKMIEYTTTVSPQSSDVEENYETSQPHRRNRLIKRSHQSQKIQVRFPLWLCQYAWDVAFERASGCWNLSLKSFRITEAVSMAFCTAAGDSDRKRLHIRKLLEARQLSIHDQDEYGHTLVYYAAMFGETKLVKYLIEHGAEVNMIPVTLSSERHHGECPFEPARRSSYLEIREHAQLLLDECECNCSDAEHDLLTLSKHPALLTCEEQLLLLQWATRVPSSSRWRWFCEFLLSDSINPQLFHTRVPDGGTILHMLADLVKDMTSESRKQKFCGLLLQGARAGADFHVPDDRLLTPFTGLVNWFNEPTVSNECNIRTWITCLARAGIDLQRYGRAEQDHKQKTGDQWFNHRHWHSWTILGFSYGSKPSDWRLWWRYPGDIFLGIFWSLIENPETAVPGSWIEDDGSSIDWWGSSLYTQRRRSGVKRKCWRRLKKEVKDDMRSGNHNPDTVRLVDELIGTVTKRADSCKHPASPSEDNYYGLREIASLLGFSRADWEVALRYIISFRGEA